MNKRTSRLSEDFFMQQQYHARNDSIYSMDSFVAELPETGSGGDLTTKLDYVSPSSSSAVSIDGRQLQHNPAIVDAKDRVVHIRSSSDMGETSQQSLLGKSSTILDSDGTDGSEAMLGHVTPVHSFFRQPYFQGADDSLDGGSVVFKNVNEKPPASQQTLNPQTSAVKQQVPKINTRDRLPSYDSVGSSGSLVRNVQPNAVTKGQSINSLPQGPKILPYHERMQQRQKRQQKAQLGGRQEPAPPRPDRHSQQPSQSTPALVPLADDLDLSLLQHFQHNPGIPSSSISAGNPYDNNPFRGADASRYQFSRQQNPPNQIELRSDFGTDDQNQDANIKLPNIPFKPPSTQINESTIHNARQMPPASLQQNNSHHNSSSFDSSDELLDLMDPNIPPPPPPPPPPPAQSHHVQHVRQESTGSVSSLGSHDRSIRDDRSVRKPRFARSFFQRLNPFTNRQHTVADFHKRNQAFLSTIERQNEFLNNIKPIVQSTGPKRAHTGSLGTPPPSRGGHRRLDSINNDDWSDKEDPDVDIPENFVQDQQKAFSAPPKTTNTTRRDNESVPIFVTDVVSKSQVRMPLDQPHRVINKGYQFETRTDNFSSSSDNDDDISSSSNSASMIRPDERTKLLPPSGISSSEHNDRWYHSYGSRNSSRLKGASTNRDASVDDWMRAEVTSRIINSAVHQDTDKSRNKTKKKRHSRRSRRAIPRGDSSSSSSISSSSPKSRNYQKWRRYQTEMLEKEREHLILQWKEEARIESEAKRKLDEEKRWYRRMFRYALEQIMLLFKYFVKMAAWVEAFFANLPLMIGAIALACANLGVDWFKFVEENLSSCQPVHFHSKQCTFPEFPGCFYCDTNTEYYKLALRFHKSCSAFAGVLAFAFLIKLIVGRRVVFDELSNPTMAAPAGLVCMTLNVVFAGHGTFGKIVVYAASSVHLCLAMWFIYMALAYQMMPEPSWFPNTVGIGISAVKTWLYCPLAGHFLMAVSLALNVIFFPISLLRVALNPKISAPVGWMQVSAPNISLYALTIMAQPTFEEEIPDINKYQKLHRMVYLPFMHFLFGLCLLGMAASVFSLRVRWKDFRNVPFSPAHAAFCCPVLSHANAVQAYRAAIMSFSDFAPGGWFRTSLYSYWITVLVSGSIITACITIRFLLNLPKWTHIDVEGEIEPPAPYETSMTLTNMVSAGETLFQPYVSPAILQANETGTLVLTRDAQGRQRFVRTRQITAIGFEPVMNVIQMEAERDVLLDWVGKNTPRRRHRTLSVPGIDFSYGSTLGTGHSGVYGMHEVTSPWTKRPRSNSMSPLGRFRTAIQK